MKLNAKALRSGMNKKFEYSKQDIYLILDNVLDTYNIGSAFRLADGIGAKKLFLCGGTETPPNHKIKKASINTTEWVDWEYKDSTLGAIQKLREEVPGIQIVAIEQSVGSVQYDKFEYTLPIALIVGNESTGVSQEVLKSCDTVVELPMFGVNVSLNVIISLAVVVYRVIDTTFTLR